MSGDCGSPPFFSYFFSPVLGQSASKGPVVQKRLNLTIINFPTSDVPVHPSQGLSANWPIAEICLSYIVCRRAMEEYIFRSDRSTSLPA